MSNPIIKVYNDYNVQLLASRLKTSSAKDPKYFDVRVDDVPVISKTWNSNEFKNFSKFVDPDHSRKVEIRIYAGKSNVFQSYILKLKENTQQESGLGEISSRLDLQELKHSHEMDKIMWLQKQRDLLRDIEILNKKVEARNKRIRALEIGLHQAKKKGEEEESIGGLANFAGPLLSKIFGEETSLEPQLGSVIEPKDLGAWAIISDLASSLNENQTAKATSIALHCINNPDDLDTILELINS